MEATKEIENKSIFDLMEDMRQLLDNFSADADQFIENRKAIEAERNSTFELFANALKPHTQQEENTDKKTPKAGNFWGF